MLKKKMVLLIMIVILVGITIQTTRLVNLSGFFPINQSSFDVSAQTLNPAKRAAPDDYMELFVLYSEEDESSKQVKSNIYHTINMAKLSAQFIDIESNRVNDVINNIDEQDLLVIATERLNGLDNYARIIDFTAGGGKTVFLIRSLFTPFDDLVGIVANRGFSRQPLQGIRLQQPIFPGMDNLTFMAIEHSVLDVELHDDVVVLASSGDRKPLIWTNRYGAGEVLYVNSTMMQSKSQRGLLLQCLAYLPDFFVSTIFNAKVMNIDDFPAPVKLGRNAEIYAAYKMTIPQFFEQVWWPDTYNLARRYNLKLTGLAMVTFNSDTLSPLEAVNETDLRQMTYFGRRLSEVGGELGIHGYNHQSLTLEGQMRHQNYGYTPWESQATMEEGLRVLQTTLREMFGDISIFSYVAPSNIISKEGRLAVKNVFPAVNVFAGIYTGPDEPGLLHQEFGRDPYLPEVVSFPRLSSGYLNSEELMWTVYSGLAHYGLVHHFIHPDDLFDPERSGGLSWEEMDRQINAIFAEIRAHFPFLRAMTISEAYKYFVKTENLQVWVNAEGNTINVQYNMAEVPAYHFLRLKDKRVSRVEGGEFQLICRQNRLYLIEGRQEQVRIFIR